VVARSGSNALSFCARSGSHCASGLGSAQGGSAHSETAQSGSHSGSGLALCALVDSRSARPGSGRAAAIR
jgi:hypothetical protein